MDSIQTTRLELVPITLEIVEAVFDGRRDDAERLTGARFPSRWPGREFVERAFGCPLDRLREDPVSCLWGGRVLVSRGPEPSVVGSVVLSGCPDASGTVEVGYGIDEAAQGKGYATEGTRAVVEWALARHDVRRVTAATLPWHTPSLRILAKVGMSAAGTRPHEIFGDLLVFERLA